MKQPYKVQNRTNTSRRVKFVKNGGTVSFPKTPTASFVENSREAGFCLTAITPLPDRDNATNSITLTSHPMGTDGRVSLFINGNLIESKRFASLSRIADRQAWFNREFGAYVQYTGKEQPTFTSVVVSQDDYRFVFEDDDIDFIFADTTNAKGDVNPTLIVEQYRLAFNIKNSKIDCTGAIDWAGILTFDDQVEGSVINSSGTVDFSDTDEMVAGLEAKGFTVIPLNDWVPPPPDVAYPRLSIAFMSEIEPDLAEPKTLTVELTDKLGRKTVHSGPISQVMDSCREKGILLRINQDQFQIGTEPYTPFTKVKATFTDRQFNSTISDDWMYSNWVNPTMVVSNNNHTVSANFGWEPLSRFWCFSYFQTTGANGNAGDVINYLDIDYRVAGTLEESQRNVTVNTDFTETCAWNTQNPILCRQLNQYQEADGVINERFAGLGGKIFDFNQARVWGPEGTIGYITEIDNYRPTAVKWTSGSYTYGYSIPEPEMPM